MQQQLFDLVPHEIAIRDNLNMRLLIPDDAPRIFAIFQADPSIQSMVTWTFGLRTVDEIRRKIEHFQETKSLRYAIVEGDELVGYIGAWQDDGYFGVTHDQEYGYGYFSDPSSRGKGIITDAAKTLMINIEAVLPVKTFALHIEDINLASQTVAKKLDFRRTEELYKEPVLGTIERRYMREV